MFYHLTRNFTTKTYRNVGLTYLWEAIFMFSFTVYVSIIGAIMLFLGFFSFVSATYHHESRSWIVGLMVAGMALVIFGIVTLPKDWHNQLSTQKARSSQSTKKASLAPHPQNMVFDGGAKKRAAAHQQLNEQATRKQLATSYQSMGKLTFNSNQKTYVLTITDSGYTKAMVYLKAHPNQAKQIKWSDSVASFEKTSRSIKKTLGPGYQLIIKDHLPKLTTLLTLKDGKPIQNFVK